MTAGTITLFVCGDVMTGRGVDQVLPHPGDPTLHEAHCRSAGDYVRLAEAAHCPLARPLDFGDIWGDARDAFARLAPDVRIVNLETAVTTSDAAWPGKGIHYRMHPANVPCLTAAALDCCVLANNHVLDWGYAGLAQTLDTLEAAGLATAGAGRDGEAAAAPALVGVAGKGRVAVLGLGSESSGIPRAWAAGPAVPGVHLLPDVSDRAVAEVGRRVAGVKTGDTLVVASIHWGGNWGHQIEGWQRRLARHLIDEAGVDVVHGHSSHHAKAIEVYRERPIFYGCGDLIDDYEGIAGHEPFRPELRLLYFPCLDARTGRLVRLDMVPLRRRRFRLSAATVEEARWLGRTLSREGAPLGTSVRVTDGALTLAW